MNTKWRGLSFILSMSIISTSFSQGQMPNSQANLQSTYPALNNIWTLVQQLPSSFQLLDIEHLLEQNPDLRPAVVNKVMTMLFCADKFQTSHNDILTIIDYSLPSSEKRLWIFSLKDKKLLFNTYVSHGITSGARLTHYFSNKYNSKATSIGVYRTEQTYYGRDGLSLRLQGLDQGFNDNASNRYIVMHGGWYVEEPFIKKYGRAGRSWGCPAIPLALTKPIIETIKDASLFVAYYPNDRWLQKSRYLTCEKGLAEQVPISQIPDLQEATDAREAILFLDKNKNGGWTENEPVLVISANNYQSVFQSPAPLRRMLRRQIEGDEYIALTALELKALKSFAALHPNEKELASVYFVIPVIKESRGYYETHMQKIGGESALGTRLQVDGTGEIPIHSTRQFSRWLGL